LNHGWPRIKRLHR